VPDLNTANDVREYLENNTNLTSEEIDRYEDSNGVFIPLKDGKQALIINKEEASMAGMSTTGLHETGHALIYKAISDNKFLAKKIGTDLYNHIEEYIGADVLSNTQFKSRYDQYKADFEEQQLFVEKKVSEADNLFNKGQIDEDTYTELKQKAEDVILKANDEGEVTEVVEKVDYKVFQRIYLSLQEDEIELANPLFRDIYNDLIEKYNQEEFNREHYFQQLSPEFAQTVTDILMQEEKEVLHNWETKHIYVKQKEQTIGQYVTETIISLREYLINKLIMDLMQNFTPDIPEEVLEEIKTSINDYNKLKVVLTNNIGRIRSTYY
jgi:DNA primase